MKFVMMIMTLSLTTHAFAFDKGWLSCKTLPFHNGQNPQIKFLVTTPDSFGRGEFILNDDFYPASLVKLPRQVVDSGVGEDGARFSVPARSIVKVDEQREPRVRISLDLPQKYETIFVKGFQFKSSLLLPTQLSAVALPSSTGTSDNRKFFYANGVCEVL